MFGFEMEQRTVKYRNPYSDAEMKWHMVR